MCFIVTSSEELNILEINTQLWGLPRITISSITYHNNLGIKSLRLQRGKSKKSLGSFIVTDFPVDLATVSDGVNQQKTISKITFEKYYQIPFLICTILTPPPHASWISQKMIFSK
jgi:hypothetical protein